MLRVRHLKKGDTVVCLSGASKGKSAKVLEVSHAKAMVQVEGIGVQKRHTKPSQTNPKGGIVEKNRWLPACKFQVSVNSKAAGRVSFEGKGKEKKRVFSKQKTKK